MTPSRAARFAWSLLLLPAGCSLGEPAAPSPEGAPLAPALALDDGLAANVEELFETRILPTCSLNGGVCHNSSTYPDLRHLAALEELARLPCGRNVDANYPDACEPPGDRVVAPGLEVGITRVSFDDAAMTATILADADVTAGLLRGVRIRRTLPGGAAFFPLPADGVDMESVGARTLTVRLATSSTETRAFFQPTLPLREERVWPSDVNGNGVSGASLGWREIVPGSPERSYLVARLWDTSQSPALMPRQCRTWNDRATRSLGCWIQGLRTDAETFPTTSTTRAARSSWRALHDERRGRRHGASSPGRVLAPAATS
jgi:hypothetical protein